MRTIARRKFMLAAAAMLAAPLARAQSPSARSRLIGIVDFGTRADFEPNLAKFREGLREGGFVEGQNLRIESRFADHDQHKINRLAEDLVRARVEVIYAPGPWGVHAAKAASSSIPIVFSGVNDPVALKFVQSLARPGRNISGVTYASHDLTKKRVQLMRDMFPSARRFGVVFDKDGAKACQIELTDIADAARQLGVEVREYSYSSPAELRSGFESAQRAQLAALIVPTTIETRRFGGQHIAQAATNKVPTMHQGPIEVGAGGLMSYGPTEGWGPRRAGSYVARILKGAKPADLPVEMPMTYELVVNQKTARAMGVKIPPAILIQADRMIE